MAPLRFTLLPFRIYSSPFLLAVVSNDAASLPLPVSKIQKCALKRYPITPLRSNAPLTKTFKLLPGFHRRKTSVNG